MTGCLLCLNKPPLCWRCVQGLLSEKVAEHQFNKSLTSLDVAFLHAVEHGEYNQEVEPNDDLPR